MASALILFGHGARDPAWAEPMRRVQAAIGQRDGALRVELAYLEFLTPTLADCAAGLVAEGVRRIVVLPMFIARSGHLKRDMPELLRQLRAAHDGVEFALAATVGESEAVIQAMAETALRLAAPCHASTGG